jgi:hypothetical protein
MIDHHFLRKCAALPAMGSTCTERTLLNHSPDFVIVFTGWQSIPCFRLEVRKLFLMPVRSNKTIRIGIATKNGVETLIAAG